MATSYRAQGIVLSAADYGEAHRIVSVYTKEFGKVDLWAVSLRKVTAKLRAGLEPPCLSELEFVQGKTKKTVTEAIPQNRYSGIRGNAERSAAALRILQSADMLLRGEEQDDDSWQALQSVLSALDTLCDSPEDCLLAEQYFFWNFVAHQGYAPRLEGMPQGQREFLSQISSRDLPWVLQNGPVPSLEGIRRHAEFYLHSIMEGTPLV